MSFMQKVTQIDMAIDIEESAVPAWVRGDFFFLSNLPRLSQPAVGSDSLEHEARLARLAIVFGYAMIEGVTRDTAKALGLAETIGTSELICGLEFPQNAMSFRSVDEFRTALVGMRAARDMIAHCLTSTTARKFKKKQENARLGGFEVDPTLLRLRHHKLAMRATTDCLNILGLAKHNNWIWCKQVE